MACPLIRVGDTGSMPWRIIYACDHMVALQATVAKGWYRAAVLAKARRLS
jgi:hypothetical protein